MWFERSFSFRIGPHLLRGRVDRVDRHPDGSYELIDYKTGRARTPSQLKDDIQLSLYQIGARESWKLDSARQSYYYLLDDERVPLEPSQEDVIRITDTATEVATGDPRPGVRAEAVVQRLLDLRLPADLPGGRALAAAEALLQLVDQVEAVLRLALGLLGVGVAGEPPRSPSRVRRSGGRALVRHLGAHRVPGRRGAASTARRSLALSFARDSSFASKSR